MNFIKNIFCQCENNSSIDYSPLAMSVPPPTREEYMKNNWYKYKVLVKIEFIGNYTDYHRS